MGDLLTFSQINIWDLEYLSLISINQQEHELSLVFLDHEKNIKLQLMFFDLFNRVGSAWVNNQIRENLFADEWELEVFYLRVLKKGVDINCFLIDFQRGETDDKSYSDFISFDFKTYKFNVIEQVC